METHSLLFLLAAIIIVLAVNWPRSKSSTAVPDPEKQGLLALQNESLKAYTDITPLLTFDWSTTKPLPIRPFKPKYHLTMALENMPLSELVAMDNTYVDRIKLRRQIMEDHHASTLACNPVGRAAVFEFYNWLIGTYLPRRFPTCYTVVDAGDPHDEKSTAKPRLLNKITNELIPLKPPVAPRVALRMIGAHVDTDFLFLLPKPDPQNPGQQVYHLEAFTTTFPSGFSTLSKLGLPLAAIHAPVPAYGSKLEKSMDRFFARLEVGKAVRRSNWTVTTHANLFTEEGTHLYADGEEESASGPEESKTANATAKTMDPSSTTLAEDIEAQKRDVMIEDCRLRSERQTLHRLPKTGALVFGFKTYLSTLEEVKNDGDGLALADAIEGFKKGSVPEMEFYKRGVVWGEKVKEYLRS